MRLEGTWNTRHIILGFEIDVNELTTKLPAAKIEDAWNFFRGPTFAVGNRVIKVGKVQGLRGLVNFWSHTNRFRRYTASPINALMAFADSADTWIRCQNDQVWLVFRNFLSMIKSIEEDGEMRLVVFQGTLMQLIPVPKRV